MINRELSYLENEAQKFIRQEDKNCLKALLKNNEWMDYNDLIKKNSQPKKKKRSIKKRKKTVKKRTNKKKKKVSTQPIYSDIKFSWPVKRHLCWLSSLFGNRTLPSGKKSFHYGLDMAALKGTPVRAAADGIVMEARYSRGYGKTILIVHNRKYKTRYAHLDKIRVSVGQKVKKDDLIGNVGDTGKVRKKGTDGSHLHFEVYALNTRINPLYVLT